MVERLRVAVASVVVTRAAAAAAAAAVRVARVAAVLVRVQYGNNLRITRNYRLIIIFIIVVVE